ncbi:WecB/TagA/CpsF family glycosyltransferase [Paracoccus tibetensis]|uniref:Polymer biosynthesis protein, WecB/TagA/CpsF family n=1 Tax=Paracoccus tibetensis TaxID=336292 RepID=A0A1G5GSR8_9RHOB|nr:WecB/TagA/CpsF family glycosyltransferase [Paracoccus tibetensis]SCY53688.1 polymer biosynthesis protein, WecB/TagA/CpsF family [Paracoccus tibetensis]
MRFEIGPASVEVNIPDKARLLDEVAARLAHGRGFALATLNVDHLEKLRHDAAFRRAYAAHDLVVADGNPVVWLARLGGKDLSLVPGSELVVPLCRLAAEAGRPVAIIAGTEEAGRKAAAALGAQVPGLSVALIAAPGFPFDPDGAEADALLDRVAAMGPGLCLLAVGAPRQERLAARGRDRCPATGFASVGAGIDFLAGHQRRAPALMRKARMEWLWRAALSPRRLGPRYLRGAMILPGLARRAMAGRKAG